ncbi:hypothetical protein RB595_008875 [Gaeumannomyces hyphopodioides]
MDCIFGKCRKSNDKPLFPDGIKVLYPEDEVVHGPIDFDVCFVHGLTGDREKTWTAHGCSEPWPKTLLPGALAGARLRTLTFGYDAYVVRASTASANRVGDHANSLLTELARVRSGAPDRPLILVAHSLGGLVCKAALLVSESSHEPRYGCIIESLRGVAFMGTPHRGAWMARWGDIAVSSLGLVKSSNKSLLKVLKTGNDYLQKIQEDFVRLLLRRRGAGRDIFVASFFEELPIAGAGLVVSKDSAVFEEGTIPFSIHANHRDMVRFATAEDSGFVKLVDQLQQWTTLGTLALEQTPLPTAASTGSFEGPPVPAGGGESSNVSAPKRSDVELCLQDLSFRRMTFRKGNIGVASEGMCRWLFKHRKFQDWAVKKHATLWIMGNPGTGKSTLLKFALAHAEELYDPDVHNVVLYFFFHGRGGELEKTTLGFWRSLLHQLLLAAPAELADLVADHKRKLSQRGKMGKGWSWEETELYCFFEQALPKVLQRRRVLVYVDALDECGKETAISLLRKFENLPEPHPASQRFHMLFTCRHYPILTHDTLFQIDPKDQNCGDITTFVCNELVTRGYDKQYPRLGEHISSRANGIFLWAKLVYKRIESDILEGRASERAVMASIDKIPQKLEELYKGITQDMLQGRRLESLRLMQLICFSRSPLTLMTMRWAMIIASVERRSYALDYANDPDFIDTDDRMRLQVKALSHGLAEASGGKFGSIQFIHQSLKDFFIESGLAILLCDEVSRQVIISRSSLQLCAVGITCQLLNWRGLIGELELSFADFEMYTANWIHYARQMPGDAASQEELLSLLGWPGHSMVNRLGEPNLIYLAAARGLPELLRSVITRTTKLDLERCIKETDVHGMTVMTIAVAGGHMECCEILVEFGADPNQRMGKGLTVLMQVARYKAGESCAGLVKIGANVHLEDGDGRTALSWAAEKGTPEICELLLDHQADIESRDRQGRSPLWWAARGGMHENCELLLARGASALAEAVELVEEQDVKRRVRGAGEEG